MGTGSSVAQTPRFPGNCTPIGRARDNAGGCGAFRVYGALLRRPRLRPYPDALRPSDCSTRTSSKSGTFLRLKEQIAKYVRQMAQTESPLALIGPNAELLAPIRLLVLPSERVGEPGNLRDVLLQRRSEVSPAQSRLPGKMRSLTGARTGAWERSVLPSCVVLRLRRPVGRNNPHGQAATY